MSVIRAVYDYFKSCPLLDGEGRVRVNFLGDRPVEYVIEEIPAEPIVKRYVDGSSIRQFRFLFGSREGYDKDAMQNMLASDFYENLSEWLEQQTRMGNLPVLEEGMESQKMEAVTTGYAFEADQQAKHARYQIQCRLIYFKE